MSCGFSQYDDYHCCDSDCGDSDCDCYQNGIVIETGTHEMRAGLAGNDSPDHIFRTILSNKIINKIHNTYIGSDAYYKTTDDKYIQYPIKQGIVQNWNQMEKIIDYMFNKELKIETEEYNMIIIEKPFRCEKNRAKLVQILFEEYRIPLLYIDYTVVASTFTTGKHNGIVLDFGYDTIWSVPVYEGYALERASNKIDMGGKHVTNYLMELLNNKINKFDMIPRKDIVVDIKHKLSFVALDSEQLQQENNVSYRLPDGNTINIGIERMKCCEILFNSSLLHKKCDYNGIHKLLYHSILKLKTFDADDKIDLINNIVLSGGNSMFKGIENRLRKEIIEYEHLCEEYAINGYLRSTIGPNKVIYKDVFNLLSKYWHEKMNVKKIIAKHWRKYSSWIGGSIIGSLSTLYGMSMRTNHYDEYGPNIAHRMFW
eukprot:77656_1